MSRLYLIPTPITPEYSFGSFSNNFPAESKNIRTFFVENEKSARQALKKIWPDFPIGDCQFILLNEHSSIEESLKFIRSKKEETLGILSEAGLPCVADPGAEVVLEAHRLGMEVVPLIGPSSIYLALMASGLTGQRFAFHGYLSKNKDERIKKLKALEQMSLREGQSQIFMETPYHNQSIWDEILQTLGEETFVCLAVDITAPTQFIQTRTIREWKKIPPPNIHKRPALFLIENLKKLPITKK